MLIKCWSNDGDVGQTFNHHWIDISCLVQPPVHPRTLMWTLGQRRQPCWKDLIIKLRTHVSNNTGPKFAMLQMSNNTTDSINATKAAMLERSHNSNGNAWDRKHLPMAAMLKRFTNVAEIRHVTDNAESEAAILERSDNASDSACDRQNWTRGHSDGEVIKMQQKNACVLSTLGKGRHMVMYTAGNTCFLQHSTKGHHAGEVSYCNGNQMGQTIMTRASIEYRAYMPQTIKTKIPIHSI